MKAIHSEQVDQRTRFCGIVDRNDRIEASAPQRKGATGGVAERSKIAARYAPPDPDRPVSEIYREAAQQFCPSSKTVATLAPRQSLIVLNAGSCVPAQDARHHVNKASTFGKRAYNL